MAAKDRAAMLTRRRRTWLICLPNVRSSAFYSLVDPDINDEGIVVFSRESGRCEEENGDGCLMECRCA
jgi:hypothetical protein